MLALLAVIPIADASAQPAPASPVTFLVQGKGWGHGRGLGQWGSLGYALKGWKVDQILAHYYGGTTAGTIDPNSELRVRLLRQDDIDTIVVSERGQLVSGAAPGTFTALRAQPQTGGGYLVQSGPGMRRAVDRRHDRAERRLPHRSRGARQRRTRRPCSRCARSGE